MQEFTALIITINPSVPSVLNSYRKFDQNFYFNLRRDPQKKLV